MVDPTVSQFLCVVSGLAGSAGVGRLSMLGFKDKTGLLAIAAWITITFTVVVGNAMGLLPAPTAHLPRSDALKYAMWVFSVGGLVMGITMLCCRPRRG